MVLGCVAVVSRDAYMRSLQTAHAALPWLVIFLFFKLFNYLDTKIPLPSAIVKHFPCNSCIYPTFALPFCANRQILLSCPAQPAPGLSIPYYNSLLAAADPTPYSPEAQRCALPRFPVFPVAGTQNRVLSRLFVPSNLILWINYLADRFLAFMQYFQFRALFFGNMGIVFLDKGCYTVFIS